MGPLIFQRQRIENVQYTSSFFLNYSITGLFEFVCFYVFSDELPISKMFILLPKTSLSIKINENNRILLLWVWWLIINMIWWNPWQGLSELALNAFRVMRADGLKPSLLALNSLINAFGEDRRDAEAFSVLQYMKENVSYISAVYH